MKQILLFSIVLLMAFNTDLFAGAGDLFSYDQQAVETELAELTELENYVSNNPTKTLSVLVQEGNQVLTGLNLSSPNGISMMFDDPPLGIPSFLWGCAFGVVGVAIVYFVTDEDKDETKKSFYGCIASTVVFGVLYAVWWSSLGWFAF